MSHQSNARRSLDTDHYSSENPPKRAKRRHSFHGNRSFDEHSFHDSRPFESLPRNDQLQHDANLQEPLPRVESETQRRTRYDLYDTNDVLTDEDIHQILLDYSRTFTFSKNVNSLEQLSDVECKQVALVNRYLQQDGAYFDEVILSLGTQLYDVLPETLNRCADLVYSHRNGLWFMHKCIANPTQKKHFGAFAETHGFVLANALAILNNVDVEFGTQGFLWLLRYMIGPATVNLSSTHTQCALWNDGLIGISSSGKYLILQYLQPIIQNNEIRRRDLLDQLQRFSDIKSPLNTESGSSFSKFCSNLVQQMGVSMNVYDELGAFMQQWQLQPNKEGNFQQSEGFSALLNSWQCGSIKRSFQDKKYSSDIEVPVVQNAFTSQRTTIEAFLSSCGQSGLKGRLALWNGKISPFKHEGYLNSFPSCVETFELNVMLQRFVWCGTIQCSLITMLHECPDFIEIHYNSDTELFRNRMNKLIHFAKQANALTRDVASILQKYQDLTARYTGVIHVGEKIFERMMSGNEIKESDVITDVQSISTSYIISERKHQLAAFGLTFGVNLRNYCSYSKITLEPFILTPDDMEMDVVPQQPQPQQPQDIAPNNHNNHNNQLQINELINGHEDSSVESSLDSFSGIATPPADAKFLRDILLFPGNIILLSSLMDRKKKLITGLMAKFEKKGEKWPAVQQIVSFAMEYGLVKLYSTGLAGNNHVIKKIELSQDISNLTDEQYIGLASLGITVFEFKKAYAGDVDWRLKKTMIARDIETTTMAKLTEENEMIKKQSGDYEWSINWLSLSTTLLISEMTPRAMSLNTAKRVIANQVNAAQINVPRIDADARGLLHHANTYLVKDKTYFDRAKLLIASQCTNDYDRLRLNTRLKSGSLKKFVVLNDGKEKHFNMNRQKERKHRMKLQVGNVVPKQIQDLKDAQ
eukprot:913180_1